MATPRPRRIVALLNAGSGARHDPKVAETVRASLGRAGAEVDVREIARGQIRGDTTGRLKLVFHRETKAVLGVHIIGEGAAELIHIGQAVMGCNGSVDYLVDTVFNYPTLAESYKVAALDAMNKMRYAARLSD